jgi:hypothetical protein
MQAEAATHAPFLTNIDPSIAPPRQRVSLTATAESVLPFDPVLDCGPVMFKVSKRLPLKIMSVLARPLYRFFMRSLPKNWPARPDFVKVPPAPKMELGCYSQDRWCDAVLECKTPDYQINVLPLNRTWSGDEVSYRERCARPLDLSDAHNQEVFLAMNHKYSSSHPDDDAMISRAGFSPAAREVIARLADNQRLLRSIDNRLKTLERDDATLEDEKESRRRGHEDMGGG